MSAWSMVDLADVAEINPRHAGTPNGDDDTVSFLGMVDVSEDGKTAAGVDRPYSEVKRGYTPFHKGDILIAKITPCFQNGKIAQADIRRALGFGSTEFHVVRPGERLDARFALHYLRRPQLRIDGARRMTGTGGQRRVPQSFLTALPIPLPSLSEQRRIASILDHVDILRAKRRDTITQSDALTRSIFVDVFGDPTVNPMGWPVTNIGSMLIGADYGTSEKAAEAGAFPVLRMNNITYDGAMDFSDLKYMDLPEDKIERYTVRDGDILFNRTNSAELVGKTAVYRGAEGLAYAGYLVRLRVSAENSPDYISHFLNSRHGKAVLRYLCKSIIGMANINAREVQAIRIPRPPTELQLRFATMICRIQDGRSRLYHSLTCLDTLFASVQSRAFAGEL